MLDGHSYVESLWSFQSGGFGMEKRVYLLILLYLLRFFSAISPSYIHPDENFQGPEIVAGKLFGYPHLQTWEFTTEKPVRSFFPLWIVYGLPMVLLRWVWTETGKEAVSPKVIFYTLRVLMFLLSFVLEDWAIHELVQSPRQRQRAVMLVAASYVTCTYQTHTFSNAVETLIVAWTLVMVQRILDNSHRSNTVSSAILGVLLTAGIFNRITFPAFVLLPGCFLLPHFFRKPLSLLAVVLTAAATSFVAIAVDTSFYHPGATLTFTLLKRPTVTPLNSILYNSSRANLSLHGLHPPYQHLVASLPLLLGPALLLFVARPRFSSLPYISALSGTTFLSFIPHQEPRFLIPAVPLILSSVRLPRSRYLSIFMYASFCFNVILGILMGIYHQGGVIPAQIWLGEQKSLGLTEVLWWRTYSPPVWLLGGANITTTDLMGMDYSQMLQLVESKSAGCWDSKSKTSALGLVAPLSSLELEDWDPRGNGRMVKELLRYFPAHVNLDDLDIGGKGALRELRRVFGRRGLAIWKVRRNCDALSA